MNCQRFRRVTFVFPKVLVANIDYDDFKGKLGVGRIHSGSMRKGQAVGLARPDGPVKTGKISELFVFDNLGRTVRGVLLPSLQFWILPS